MRGLPVLGNLDRLMGARVDGVLRTNSPTPAQRPHRDVITSFANEKP